MYYEKIKEKLKSNEDDFARKAERAFESQANVCQRFCYYKNIYEQLKKVQHVVVQYREFSPLTKETFEKSEKRLSLEEKLHIGLLWKLYYTSKDKSETDRACQEDFVATFVMSPKYIENVEHFWKLHIQGRKNIPKYADRLKNHIIDALACWMGNYNNCSLNLQALGLDKLKNCMEVIEKAFNLPMSTKSDSMEEILSEQILESYLDFLENGNLPGFYLTMVPVTRAITTGKISSGYPKYLKKEYKYNLKKLHPYIEEINYLKNLYQDVLEEMKPFENIFLKEE